MKLDLSGIWSICQEEVKDIDQICSEAYGASLERTLELRLQSTGMRCRSGDTGGGRVFGGSSVASNPDSLSGRKSDRGQNLSYCR